MLEFFTNKLFVKNINFSGKGFQIQKDFFRNFEKIKNLFFKISKNQKFIFQNF